MAEPALSIQAPVVSSLLKGLVPENQTTPRIFIAATRMNDGKTTLALGLISALRERSKRIGYIKPVGQRFVEVDGHKIDEDSVLINQVFGGNDPIAEMSPVAVEPEFTIGSVLQVLVENLQLKDRFVLATEGNQILSPEVTVKDAGLAEGAKILLIPDPTGG